MKVFKRYLDYLRDKWLHIVNDFDLTLTSTAIYLMPILKDKNVFMLRINDALE